MRRWACSASSAPGYLEAGQTLEDGRDTTTSTIGLRLPMQRRHYTQIGLVPMFRYRFDAGQSRWFVEGGIGLSYMNEPHQAESKRFSKQWDFSDHLSLGRNFGSARQDQQGLYIKHVFNAGETFVQLHYAHSV